MLGSVLGGGLLDTLTDAIRALLEGLVAEGLVVKLVSNTRNTNRKAAAE